MRRDFVGPGAVVETAWTERLVPLYVGERIDGDLRPDRRRPEVESLAVLCLHSKETLEPFVYRTPEILLELLVELCGTRDLVAEERRAKLLRPLGGERHEEHVVHPLANGRAPLGISLNTVRKLGERSAKVAEETLRHKTVQRFLRPEVAGKKRGVNLRATAYLTRRGKLVPLLGKFDFGGGDNSLPRPLPVYALFSLHLATPVFVITRLLYHNLFSASIGSRRKKGRMQLDFPTPKGRWESATGLQRQR